MRWTLAVATSLWMGSGLAADACVDGMQLYVEGNHTKAIKVFEVAAKKGDACAQFQLGMMYYYGHGSKKDDKKAREWLTKSAKGGFDKAQGTLAMLK